MNEKYPWASPLPDGVTTIRANDYKVVTRFAAEPEFPPLTPEQQAELDTLIKDAQERLVEDYLYGAQPRVEKVVDGEVVEDLELPAPPRTDPGDT